jgi:hypothetical protein
VKTVSIAPFQFLDITKPKPFTPQVRGRTGRVRASGLVRGFSISSHDWNSAAQRARKGAVDAILTATMPTIAVRKPNFFRVWARAIERW